MTKLTAAEIAAFEACKSGKEWDALCDAAKAARCGQYPDDWWPEMKLSGRMDRILARFGESSDIKAFTVDRDGSRRPL